MNDDQAIFIQAVREAEVLPAIARAQSSTIYACERRIFDHSYLGFLRQQIALEPRGPEWTAVLAARLAALAPYCDLPTLSGIVSTHAGDYFVRVDPHNHQVIHHEPLHPPENA